MTNPSSKATVPGSRELQTSSSSPGGAATSTKSDGGANPYEPQVMGFFKKVGMHDPNVENYSSRDFYSNLLCNTLKTHTVRRGHVTCFATVTPAVANYFGGLHGGAVAAIAERVAIATTRTVVGEDKEIFLVDLGMSYLSAAPKDAELIVDGAVVKSGRNITAVSIEFRMKKTGKLLFTSRATFHNSPLAKL
ncbi:Thioesterase superfamily [Gossypium australe]|uniref:Thioesterase superfamily n=1 Tax=Gossypium australe TaxID=47621 RepID=A0A5B6VJS8_9ROSI|nr:Thioesterase superfamily [Gossypium australe]